MSTITSPNADALIPNDAHQHDVDCLHAEDVFDSKPGPSFEFLEEDETFMKHLAQGGNNPSASVDQWARNRLDKYRVFKGLNTDVKMEDMPLAECSSLLTRFFAQVKKKNGRLYPTGTLMGLYRAFQRILRRAQEVRVQATGINEVPFLMCNNPLFKSVEVSCCLSMERSRNEGANAPRKKAAVISLSDEANILNHACTNVVHPRGLQAQCIYYLLCRFAIRGGHELYNLDKCDFQFGLDEAGRFVRYDERLLKNYKVSLDRFQEEHFREPVTLHDADMVMSLETLISHLPVSGTFLFYQCIDNPRTHAWYSTLRVSAKKLNGFMRMIHAECGLMIDAVTNKSGWTTCVTRMASKGVPPSVGMRITGHKSQGAYIRYDRSLEAQVRAAQQCAGEGSSYGANVEVETTLFKLKVIAGGRDQRVSSKKIKLDPSTPEAKPMEVPMEAEVASVMDLPIAVMSGAPVAAMSIIPLPAVNVAPVATVNITDLAPVKVVDVDPQVEPIVAVEAPYIDAAADGWMDTLNWDQLMTGYDRVTNVNPIAAIFGKIANMSNCTINITIGNFNAPKQ